MIFTLQTPSWADDIRDFQIEGMSVGDSALDYFSKDEIKKKINSYSDKGYIYPSKEFYALTFKNLPKFEIYDDVQVHLKDKDYTYKIYSLTGIILYANNIKDCYKKFNEIELELDILFNFTKKIGDKKKRKHVGDASGKSTSVDVWYIFNNQDSVYLACEDWSEETYIIDDLVINFGLQEYQEWMNNRAFK